MRTGLEYDPMAEAYVVGHLPDGRAIWAHDLMFHASLIIGPPGVPLYDDRWCYPDLAAAVLAGQAWMLHGGPEPDGWHRHPATGRRRPDCDPKQEHIRW